jgi:hypothetical protein
MLTCLTVLPTLFDSHRPVGSKASFSNIGNHKGYHHKADTSNIRLSTKVNFPKLVTGETDYIDQYKDREDQVMEEQKPEEPEVDEVDEVEEPGASGETRMSDEAGAPQEAGTSNKTAATDKVGASQKAKKPEPTI